MAVESLVQQLLDEIADTGRTPDEVCSDCAELLPEVRRRWRNMQAVKAELDALFPVLDDGQNAEVSSRHRTDGELPRIPGYDVEARVGHGGMGVIYRARHHRLNRVVALKMLIAGAYARPHERARFQREAEAVASLQHPNIVAVYDVGDHDGCPYFTMELLEGGSLDQKLSGTPLPANQAATLLITLADAMQAAHQAGIVHRDLKPANILLTADGTPKIADFGLARQFEGQPALTLSGVQIGTPSYMAPEQVNGIAGTIGPAADIYALGAVLYEMLTGRPPFRGESAAETQRQVIDQEPVSPSRLNTKVPRDLETICLKCLSKEPERRYASVRALADDLRRFEEGRPILSRPIGWGQRSWLWCRRNPMAAALLVMALALVSLASGGAVWLLQQRAELRNEVVTTVAQAVSLRQAFHFHEARQLLEQVRQRMERAGSVDLRQQVDLAWADVKLAQRLDDARSRATTFVDGVFSQTAAEPLYASAFADAGLGKDGDASEAMAAAVRASPMRLEIVAALDAWASITPTLQRREWLLAVARSADPDKVRDRLRQPDLWLDAARLTRVATESNVAELSPQLATALGRVSRMSGGNAVALLTATQNRFPQDFWVTFELAWALNQERRTDESLGYFRAALALRPNSSAAHSGLGEILLHMGRLDEAIDRLEQALQLDPRNLFALNNIALALRSKGHVDAAIERYQQALDIAPNSPTLHSNLGLALRGLGRLDQATEHLRQSISIDPNFASGHVGLGLMLLEKGRVDEAFDQMQQCLRLDPKNGAARSYLIPLLRNKGRLAEAIDQLEQVVEQQGQTSTTALTQLARDRYDAACANVRAAAGQGSENAQPGEPERAVMRRQALGWLRANLEQTVRQRNEGKVLNWSLATWLSDPALAGIRDPAALAKLPDAEREQWRRFWLDVAANIAVDPLEQSWEHAARRQWDRAVDDYARTLIRCPMDSGHFWFEYAAVSLLAGDRPAYARICARLIRQCGKAGGPRSYHVARTCTLVPDAVTDVLLPGCLAEKELKDSAQQFWSLTEQGALAYRAGRFQQAVTFCEQSLRANPRPGCALVNWLWLAMANQRLGRVEDARRWQDKAQAWLDQWRDGMPARAEVMFGLHLHNWLEAHVLRREAEALIQLDIPGKGPENPERGATEK